MRVTPRSTLLATALVGAIAAATLTGVAAPALADSSSTVTVFTTQNLLNAIVNDSVPELTIVVGADIDASQVGHLQFQNTTVDLEGSTLKTGGVTASNLTIEDTSRDGSGEWDASGAESGEPGFGAAGGITINSGTVVAMGGGGTAGIGEGGRFQTEQPSTITINGGNVSATSENGPGIGGTSAVTTITGGTVKAVALGDGDGDGFGIGGIGSGVTTTISGGNVTAIGATYEEGIGTRDTGGGSISITGGTTTATGGDLADGSLGNGTADGITTVGPQAVVNVNTRFGGLGTVNIAGKVTVTGDASSANWIVTSQPTLNILGGGILSGAGTLSGDNNASIINSGTLDFGTVVDAIDTGSSDRLAISGHDYVLGFNSNPPDGSPSTTSTLRFYSSKFAGSGKALPVLPDTSTAHFVGWSTATDSTGVALTTTTKITADTTFYAVWTPIPSFDVTFDSNSPDASPSTTTTVHLATNEFAGSGKTIPTLADKASEIFGGWADSNGTPLTTTTTISANTTFYAVWKPVTNLTISQSATTANIGDTVTFTVQGTDADEDTSDQTAFATFAPLGNNQPGATPNSVVFRQSGQEGVLVTLEPSPGFPYGFAEYATVVVNAAPPAAPRNFTVSTLQDLESAVATGSPSTPVGTITLDGDIDATGTGEVNLSNITLDLAGSTLTTNEIDATGTTIEDSSRDGSGVLIADASHGYYTAGISTAGGTVIKSGTITALGGFLGAGIGGYSTTVDYSASPNLLTVSGGTVTATGGMYSPGLADNAAISLTGGSVSALEGAYSGDSIANSGTEDLGGSATITVGPQAKLTIDSAILDAASIDVSGVLAFAGDANATWQLWYSTSLNIHAGGLFTGAGILEGPGNVTNNGTIDFGTVKDVANSDTDGLTIAGHDYLLWFDYSQEIRLYSNKFAGSGTQIPTRDDQAGRIFTGWVAGPTALTSTTKITADTPFASTFSDITSLTAAVSPTTTVAGVPTGVTVTGTDAQGRTSDQTAFAYFYSPDASVFSPGAGSVQSTIAGTHTVFVSVGSGVQGEADFTVTPGPVATLAFVNAPTSATRGSSKSFAVTAADAFGNSLGSVTNDTTFSSPGDTIDGHSVTFDGEAGDHTVTATDGAASIDTTVSVSAGAPVSLAFATPPTTVLLGSTHSFTVTGKDAAGNLLGDVTSDTTFTSPGNTVDDSGAITFNATGPTSVTATDGDASRTISLTVVDVPVATLTLTAPTTTVTAGNSLTFTVAGTDADSNPLSGVPAASVLTSDVTSDVITNKSIAFTAAGDHTITATDGSVTTTLVITVIPGAFHYTLLPNTSTAALDASRTFSVEKVDNYGNVIATVTTGVKISSSTGHDTVTGFVVRFGSVGTRTITANIGSSALYLTVTVSKDVAAVTVTAPSSQTAGKSASVHVDLTPGESGAVPVGKVHVHYGSKYVAATITSANGVTVKLPVITKAGSYPLSVVYLGSTTYQSHSSPVQPFTIVPAAFSKLVFDSTATKVTMGTHLVAVDTVDAYGNIIEYDTAVTLTGTGPWTVGTAGNVTFTAAGKATIKATADGHSVTRNFTITV